MSTQALLDEKSAALASLWDKQSAILEAQTDPKSALEGEDQRRFMDFDRQHEQLAKEVAMLRSKLDREEAIKQAEMESLDGPGGSGNDTAKSVNLGDLMKSVGRKDHVELCLPNIVNRPTFAAGTKVNKGFLAPTQFEYEDPSRVDPKTGMQQLTDEMPVNSVMVRKGGAGAPLSEEVFSLNTTVSGVDSSFALRIAPLVTELFNGVSMMKLCQVITTEDINEIKFSVRQKLATLTGNDVSAFDGVGGTDAANTNANSIIEAMLAGNGFAYVGEGNPIPEARQTFKGISLQPKKGGWLTPVTWELMHRVSGWDVENLIVSDAAELVELVLGHLFMLGTGGGTDHSMPEGLRTEVIKTANSARHVTGGQDDHEPTYSELVELMHKINSGYAMSPSAAWLAKWSTCGAIRRITDDDGRPIFDTDVHGEFYGRILGKPLLPDESLPALGDNVQGAIIFGDFSRYFVRLAQGLRLDYSWEAGFKTDEEYWRFLISFDGRIAIPAAFAGFNCKNT